LYFASRRRLEQKRDLLDAHGRQPAWFAHHREPPGKVPPVERHVEEESSVTLKKKRRAATALLMLGGCMPICVWCSWKRCRSSAVAMSGERPTKAANARTLRT
jgi:hypothetical protein